MYLKSTAQTVSTRQKDGSLWKSLSRRKLNRSQGKVLNNTIDSGSAGPLNFVGWEST